MKLTMKNSIVIALLFCSGALFSQQEAQFASGFQNPYIYNPAAGGLSSVTQIDLVARLQWVGYGGGPKTMNFSACMLRWRNVLSHCSHEKMSSVEAKKYDCNNR